ncbi:MAG: hypothetical protein Q9217_006213 [Psora testacea]
MGVATSRELATDITNCADRGVGIESVLEDPKWKIAYKRLTARQRQSIRKITSTPPKENTLSRLRQLQKSDVGIPEKLRPQYELWENPKNFFNHSFSVVKAEDAVPRVYIELRRIVDRNIVDPIRARIYAVALYNLRLLLDKKESLKLKAKVKTEIEQVIFDSPLIDDPLDEISKWIRVFLKFGERMKAIAEGNGGLGALFVLPSSLLSMRQ